MDASGDQSDEQQASEKPIGIEEQKTIERRKQRQNRKDQLKMSMNLPQQQLRKL